VESVVTSDLVLTAHVLKILPVLVVNMNSMLVNTTFVKMALHALIMAHLIHANVHQDIKERTVKKILLTVRITHVHQEQLALI
jgi:hypothetical protein